MAIYDVSTTEKKASPELVAGGTLYADSPIGTILPYGGASAPSGWFLCQGQAVSRTTYSELFAVIGTAFGAGDGSTTFNLPDTRGKTTMGVETGHALGASENGALPNVKGYIPTIMKWNSAISANGAFDTSGETYNCVAPAVGSAWGAVGIGFDASNSNSIYTDGQTKVDPANVRVNYIIKAKMIGIPSDFMSKMDETINENATSPVSASNKLVTQNDALIYYQSDSSSITDFNNAVPQTGKGAIQMFYLGSDITNAPTSSGGGFIVVAEQLSTTYISQLATQIGTNNKYTRSKSTSGWSSWQKLVTESDLNKAITVTSPDNNIVISDSRLVTNNLVMVSGYIKSGTQLAFNTSQVQIGKLSVSGRTIRGSGPCSLFLYSNDLFGVNGPNTIPAIWKTAQGWLTIGRDVANNPRLSEDSWFTVMLPLN